MGNRFSKSIVLSVMALLVVVGIVLAANFDVDSFDALNPNLTADSSTTSVNSALGDAEGTILGGERDVVLNYDSGTGNVTFVVNTASSRAEFSSQPETTGNFVITWDGNDDDATNMAYGLGGADLTNGSGNDRFQINVDSADSAFDLTLTVYEDVSNYSFYVLNETDDLKGVGRTYFIDFADFTDVGSGATWTSVEAITLLMQGSTDLDFTLDLITINNSGDSFMDMGDLPSGYGNTMLVNNGPGHLIGGGLYLGSAVDVESDGQTDADANGDGTDDDGVTPTGDWSDFTGEVDVDVTGGRGCLSAWIDWTANGFAPGADGDFDDGYELVVDNQPVDSTTNPNSFSFTIGDVSNETVYARFRLVPDSDNDGDCSDQSAVPYTGQVVGGEVEDYQWGFGPNAVQMTGMGSSSGIAVAAIVGGVLALGAVGVVWSNKRR